MGTYRNWYMNYATLQNSREMDGSLVYDITGKPVHGLSKHLCALEWTRNEKDNETNHISVAQSV